MIYLMNKLSLTISSKMNRFDDKCFDIRGQLVYSRNLNMPLWPKKIPQKKVADRMLQSSK